MKLAAARLAPDQLRLPRLFTLSLGWESSGNPRNVRFKTRMNPHHARNRPCKTKWSLPSLVSSRFDPGTLSDGRFVGNVLGGICFRRGLIVMDCHFQGHRLVVAILSRGRRCVTHTGSVHFDRCRIVCARRGHVLH
uniref:Putative n-cam ig domain-containing protein n=1 Tax=Ixodes ricinus TaxID=34613 RepID=A0A0K8RBC5_IXORI